MSKCWKCQDDFISLLKSDGLPYKTRDRCKCTDKKYRDKHKEQIKLYRDQYYLNNQDKIKEYREVNKDKIQEQRKLFYENNKVLWVGLRNGWRGGWREGKGGVRV